GWAGAAAISPVAGGARRPAGPAGPPGRGADRVQARGGADEQQPRAGFAAAARWPALGQTQTNQRSLLVQAQPLPPKSFWSVPNLDSSQLYVQPRPINGY